MSTTIEQPTPCSNDHSLYSLDSGIQQYQKIVTPFSYEQVVKQFNQMDNVKLTVADNGVYNHRSSSGMIVVSSTNCTCSSRISMMLPCRLMLAARKMEGCDLFDEGLFSQRWTREYYYQNLALLPEQVDRDGIASSTLTRQAQNPKKVLSQHEKYRKAFPLCRHLAELASEETRERYVQRLELIFSLGRSWEAGLEVQLTQGDTELPPQPPCSSDERLPERAKG